MKSSDGNTEGFLVGTYDDATLGKFDIKCKNWEENVVVRKLHHLLYLSDLMKASPKMKLFALI